MTVTEQAIYAQQIKGKTKYRFAGKLANGKDSDNVISMWLPSIQEAYRILTSNRNLRSFRAIEEA